MKVLIVEDDKIQATRLKMQLSHLSVSDIYFAEDGLEAIDVCRKFDIDLLFCDIQMPRMDGVSFLSKLNKISPDVSVVIFSSVEDAILKITFDMCSMRIRFCSRYPKPISDSVLEDIVLEHSNFLSKKTAHSVSQIQIGSHDVFEGFENDRFFCFYQPQFDLSNGNLSGVESLVRLSHPEYGVLGPYHFIDLIGDLGCKNQLFEIVLEKSVKLMASMSKELKLSVNFSQECLETDVYDFVMAVCKKYDFPVNKLTLEMTEEDVYQCSIDSLANLARLRVAGVGLAIDDFGTGFASLSQLVQLPFTELKIDKAFLENIHSNYKNKQITEICLLLAHSLGLHCVVEGIENEEAYLFAKRIGIDTCQATTHPNRLGRRIFIRCTKNISALNWGISSHKARV
nr:EAL domain-containing response regulator [Enterovibrio nigricans]